MIRQIGYFNLNGDDLIRMVGLSPDHMVVGAEWDWAMQQVRLVVTGPKMPPNIEGTSISQAAYSVNTTTNPDGSVTYEYVWP